MEIYIIKETKYFKNGKERAKTLTKGYSNLEEAIKEVDKIVNGTCTGLKIIKDLIFCDEGKRYNALGKSIYSNVYYERGIFDKENWEIKIFYEVNKYEL